MKSFMISMAAVVCMAGLSYGQCGAGGCSVGSRSAATATYTYSAPQMTANGYSVQQEAVYGPFGRFRGWREVLVPNEAPAVPATTAAAAKPAAKDCGCDVCPLPTAKKAVSSSLPAMLDPADLTEVKPEPGMAMYQDKSGNLYYLSRDAVQQAKGLIPAGKFVWNAGN